jgi:phosphoribosyl-ATP pyrophosphohydrolase/phosphoribosyl-AMP cyclohydrolase
LNSTAELPVTQVANHASTVNSRQNGWEIVDAQLKDRTRYGEKSTNPHTLAMNASTAQSEQVEVLSYLGQMMAERKAADQTRLMLQSCTTKVSTKFLEKSVKKPSRQ